MPCLPCSAPCPACRMISVLFLVLSTALSCPQSIMSFSLSCGILYPALRNALPFALSSTLPPFPVPVLPWLVPVPVHPSAPVTAPIPVAAPPCPALVRPIPVLSLPPSPPCPVLPCPGPSRYLSPSLSLFMLLPLPLSLSCIALSCPASALPCSYP